MRFRWISALAVVAALMAAATPAEAVIVAPGTTVPLLGDPAPPTGTLEASVVTPFSNGDLEGIVRSAVIREAGGTLTFLYQISNGENSSTVSSASEFNFSAAPTTDVNFSLVAGFYAGLYPSVFVTPAGPSPQPYFADRSLDTDTVGFSFQSDLLGDLGLLPGSDSNVYYIRTPNTTFATGNTGVINGITANIATFQPTGAPIPEPSTVISVVAGLPLLGFYALRRRRAQKV